MRGFAIDTARVNHGTAGTSVGEKQGQAPAQVSFSPIQPYLFPAYPSVPFKHLSCQAAPVMRKSVAQHPSFSEPVTVPMANGDLIHVVIGLYPVKQRQKPELFLSGFQQIGVPAQLIAHQKHIHSRCHNKAFRRHRSSHPSPSRPGSRRSLP